MVTGHFGLAAGVKSEAQFVPLWALMLATVWLDVLAGPLFAVGIEEIDDAPGTNGGYGDVIIHADWTHSLVGAAVISVVTGLIATRWWGRRGGLVIGAVVFSHWILDLIVHRDDMPIFPGNAGGIRVGFGLWEHHAASALVELALIVVGAFLYWRAATKLDRRLGNIVAALIVLAGTIVLASDVYVG